MSLRIAVIGASNRGLAMARLFCEIGGCPTVAFADPYEPMREPVARRFPNAAFYADAEGMLARDDIDAVLVTSADHAHVENALAVLERRLPLFLEKPMAQSIEGCDRILHAWRRAGSVFLVGLELRECILFRRVREMLDAGDIGTPVMGLAVDNVSVGGQYFYHNRYRRKEYTRSLLLQKGVHTIDILNWMMGGNPRRVYGTGGLSFFGRKEPAEKRCRDCDRAGSCQYYVSVAGITLDYGAVSKIDDGCVWSRDVDVNDNSQLAIDYDNGARATYMECHFTPEYTREFTLFGDEGKLTAFYNNAGDFAIRLSHRGTEEVREVRPQPEPGGHGGSDPGIVRTFLRAVESGETPLAMLIGARNATAVAAAGEDSIESGLPVDIPPPPV